MSPSRGFNVLLRARVHTIRPQTTRRYSKFVSAVTNLQNKSQVYISRCDDPYLNLSVEHYLLQKTPPESTVLFLYTNRPSIIIGRNQNPWNEVHLGLVRNGEKPVDLVRRRSGGGTVFHDQGNVNYSVICPTPVFDRDKHAQMVVRALQKLGVHQARVNVRHDIVLDKMDVVKKAEGPATVKKTFKISGSAYKLTRMRSLHHGTCLLSSPNIKTIGGYLRSPLKGLLEARGVESVSSPIANVEVPNEEFEEAVVAEFGSMYGAGEPMILTGIEKKVPEIAKGLKEIMSDDWTYCQTPQFTFSAHINSKILNFTAKHGVVSEVELLSSTGKPVTFSITQILDKKIHEITDWREALGHETMEHVDELFGISRRPLSPTEVQELYTNREKTKKEA